MAVNAQGKSRFKVGSLAIGEGPSDGGNGTIGSTASPVFIKGISAFTATINAAALSGTTLTFTSGLTQVAAVAVGGVQVNPGGSTAGTVTPNDIIALAGDAVIAIPPANFLNTGLVYNAFVKANGTIDLVISNPQAGSLVLVAGQWTFLIIKLISG